MLDFEQSWGDSVDIVLAILVFVQWSCILILTCRLGNELSVEVRMTDSIRRRMFNILCCAYRTFYRKPKSTNKCTRSLAKVRYVYIFLFAETYVGVENISYICQWPCTFVGWFRQRIFNLWYVTWSITILFLIMYVLFQAESVRDAAWGCDWVGTPVQFQRCLVLIIATANKGFALTAGKFVPVCNETMMNVS
jgi:hypothetical protein